MAARLAQVEHLNQQLSAKVAAQAQELEALRAAAAAPGNAQAAGAEGPDAGLPGSQRPSEVEVLRAECSRLKAQVAEMSKFIADYGLKFVPHKDGGDCAEQAAAPPSAKQPAEPVGGTTVDIQVLRARVEALNASLETDGAQVVRKQVGGVNRACLAADAPPALPLTFFGDGVKLADYAFMPYNSVPAQKLIKDILDGLFPSVLQDEHPGGVALKVVDRTSFIFKVWLRDHARLDAELQDGGERLRLVGGGGAVRAPADALGAGERLLAKLPERVVRGGRVVEIRGPLAEHLGLAAAARSRCSSAPPPGGEEPAPPGAAPPTGGAPGELSLLDACRDPGAPTARLQVKLETGHRVTLLMEGHATIGALWEALDRWRSKHSIARAEAGGRRCSLRTAFPPRTYSDRLQTLEAAGLTPSATLFVAVDVEGM